MARGDYAVRVTETSTDEVGELARDWLRTFIDAADLGPADFVVDLRGPDEAPVPVSPDALRGTATAPRTRLAPQRSAQEAVLAAVGARVDGWKVKGDDADAIAAKTNTLAQASMKLGEAMYKQQQEGQPGAGEPGAAASGEPGKKEDVVDAEFTEVDDDKKKSA